MPKERRYKKIKFSPTRQILADYNQVAATLPRVSGLIEIDVTKALTKMDEISEDKGIKVSMTAWVAKCVSQAVSENRHLNSYRKGRKIIIFDDIDISVIIEIVTKSGKKVPYNYVIRNCETKSVQMIMDEIRSYQDKKISETEQLTRNTTSYTSFYTLLPKFFRRFVIRTVIKNPFRLKKLIGTVGITSLGMFIKGQGGYAVPFPDKTLNLAIGGIKEDLVMKEGKPTERKILCTTFLFDHDIVDGAPAARFVSKLSKLMGEASYLTNLKEI